MGSTTKTVLLLGDQNDPFVQGIDYLYKQAETQPWLASFLADNVSILKEQMTHWESTLRETMGVFHTFQELADKYRTKPDPVGMSHGFLVFIMRQALLLQYVFFFFFTIMGAIKHGNNLLTNDIELPSGSPALSTTPKRYQSAEVY